MPARVMADESPSSQAGLELELELELDPAPDRAQYSWTTLSVQLPSDTWAWMTKRNRSDRRDV